MTWEQMCAWLASLPDDDPRKHELRAHIYMTLARASWRRVDQLQAAERRRSARHGSRPPRAYQDMHGRETVTEGV